jgi:hypothetical protein
MSVLLEAQRISLAVAAEARLAGKSLTKAFTKDTVMCLLHHWPCRSKEPVSLSNNTVIHCICERYIVLGFRKNCSCAKGYRD